MELHWCSQVYWKKTVVRGDFVYYDFPSSAVYGLVEESEQVKSHVSGVDGVFTTATL